MVEEDYELIYKTWNDKVKKRDYYIEPTQEMIDFYLDKGYLHIRAQRTASTSIWDKIGGDSRHIGAFQWKKALGKKWNDLFTFSIARNPYDRFVSSYYQFAKDPRDVNTYLKEQGIAWITRIRFFSLLPQNSYFHDKKGNLLINYLGRFEELEKAWKYIKRKTGLKGKLPHVGKSRKDTLNAYSKNLIYPLYKKDFELLGYEK